MSPNAANPDNVVPHGICFAPSSRASAASACSIVSPIQRSNDDNFSVKHRWRARFVAAAAGGPPLSHSSSNEINDELVDDEAQRQHGAKNRRGLCANSPADKLWG